MSSLGSRVKWSFYLAIHVFSLCIFQFMCCSTIRSPKEDKVPAIFAFGDSIMDPGNNNEMLTIVRSNFPPYGKDFVDQRATGRFSNGRIPSDFLAEELGIKKTVPAFLDPSLEEGDLLTGVSFASSGSGYDPFTSQILFVKSLTTQLKMFNEYITRIIGIVGLEGTNFILSNSISFVVTGGDDLANTYFSLPFRRMEYDIDSYTDFLLDLAMPFFERLYKLGARRIGVSNVPPIGCLPAQRTLAGGLMRECPKHYNEAVQLFNSKLKAQLQNLSIKLPKSKVVYIDLYSIMLDLILNHTHYGFEVVDRGCCGTGLIEGGILCNSFSLLCDVEKYVFWDSYHPTEKAYQIIMQQITEKYIPHFFHVK